MSPLDIVSRLRGWEGTCFLVLSAPCNEHSRLEPGSSPLLLQIRQLRPRESKPWTPPRPWLSLLAVHLWLGEITQILTSVCQCFPLFLPLIQQGTHSASWPQWKLMARLSGFCSPKVKSTKENSVWKKFFLDCTDNIECSCSL